MKMTRRAMMTTAVIAGLTLTGCGGGEEDKDPATTDSSSSSPSTSTSPSKAPEETGPPRAESALVVADPKIKGLKTTKVGDGTKGDIIVPTGSVTVTSVATVEEIPGELVEDTGTLRPADGEKFVLVTLEHTKAKLAKGSVAAGLGDPLLQVTRGKDSAELDLPDSGKSATYLLSVPAKGDSSIAVSQSGLTQEVDLADGQRVTDSVAQTYYRKTREVKPKDGPTISPTKVDVVHTNGNDKTVSVSLDTPVTKVSLAPWVEGRGWAQEGTAWLSVDGSVSRQSASGVLSPGQTQAKFTVEYGDGESEAMNVHLAPEQSSGEIHKSVAVPVDTESVTLLTTAGMEVWALEGYTVQGPGTVMLKSDRLEVDFGAPAS